MNATDLTLRLKAYAAKRTGEFDYGTTAQAAKAGIYLAILSDPTVRPAVEAYLDYMEAADVVLQ